MKTGNLPFAFAHIEPLDDEQYSADIEASHRLSDTYDEITQTSAASRTLAGTERTYSNTFSGVMKSRDDDKPSDT